MLRQQIDDALKEATKKQDPLRRSTLRLVIAAIKDRQIQLRSEDGADELDDEGITALLARMIKQRRDSAQAYAKGGRDELADRERAEIGIIEEFLPRQLTEEEQARAIADAIASVGAQGIRDMGKVMAELKAAHAGRMDFAKVSAAVKAALI